MLHTGTRHQQTDLWTSVSHDQSLPGSVDIMFTSLSNNSSDTSGGLRSRLQAR